MRVIELRAQNFMGLKAVEITPNEHLVTVSGRNGQGKQQPVSEPVLTPDGWRPIGDLQVGDEVIGVDGLPVKVTGVFPQEIRETWEVVVADGGRTRCGPEHLWTVSRWSAGGGRGGKRPTRWVTQTLTTAELVAGGLKINKGASRKWALPVLEPVHYSLQRDVLPIDPYTLGVILGDAHVAENGYVQLTTDTEIIDSLGVEGYRRVLDSEGIEILGTGHWGFRLQALGLAGKVSDQKFIPPPYLGATPAERAALLAGLLDTDGCPNTKRHAQSCEFSTASPQLADDVVALVRSLGWRVSAPKPRTAKFTYKGEKREGKPRYRMNIRSTTNPFRLRRKAQRWVPSDELRPLHRFIDRIERVDDEDSVCIAVDAADGLYVTRDYLVTHNTSVLNALFGALAGGDAAKSIPMPIRQGAASAEVVVDLGELRVERVWKDGGASTGALKVTAADGSKLATPQAVLDKLIGSLTFDPLAFSRLDQRRQVEALLGIVRLPFDPAAVAAERQEVYDRRRDVQREVRRLQGELANKPEPQPDTPDDEVSVAELAEQHRAAMSAQATHLQLTRDAEDVDRDVLRLVQRRDQIAAEIGRLQSALDRTREDLSARRRDSADRHTEVVRSLGQLPDGAAIEQRLRQADETNQQVRLKVERATLAEMAAEQQRRADALTAQLDALDDRRRRAIAAADMPLDDLSFDEQGVTYCGVPLKACSGAEQLRVSVAIAMAANPSLRVIRITDGSLLDDDGMRLLAEMARDRDVQCWVERVDSSGEVGIVIEDGQVYAVNEPEPTVAR